MKTIIFAVLAFFATFAHADQYRSYKSSAGTRVDDYMTYYAKNFNELKEEQLHAYRGCKLLTAKVFIKKEGLAPNKTIVGAFDCSRKMDSAPYVDKRYYVFVSDKTGFYFP